MNAKRYAKMIQPVQVQDHQMISKNAQYLAIGRKAIERYEARLKVHAERISDVQRRAELWSALGELYEGLFNDPKEALNYHQKALEEHPKAWASIWGLRRLKRQEEDLKSVLYFLDKELEEVSDRKSLSLLKFERINAILYLGKNPEQAMKESLAWAEISKGKKVEGLPWMGLAHAYVQWDILASVGEWDLLAEALRKPLSIEKFKFLQNPLKRRLWILNRYILGDMQEAEALLKELWKDESQGPLIFNRVLQMQMEALNQDFGSLEYLYGKGVRWHTDDSLRQRDILNLAKQLRAGERDDEAEKLLKKYIEGASFIHRHLQTELLEIQKEKGQVIEEAKTLGFGLKLEGNPFKASDIYYQIGQLLWDALKDEHQALDMFEKALKVDPSHRLALEAAVEIYRWEKNWHRLEEIYQSELSQRKDPEVWERHFELGWLLEFKLNKREEAFRHYREVLKVKADHWPSLMGIFRLGVLLQKWNEVLDIYITSERSLSALDQHLDILSRIGWIASHYLNEDGIAIRAFEKIWKVDPYYALVNIELEALYLRRANDSDLIRLYEANAEKASDEIMSATYALVGGQLASEFLGEYRKAEQLYRYALKKKEDFWPAYWGLEDIFLAEKAWKEWVLLKDREIELTTAGSAHWLSALRLKADLLGHHLKRWEEQREIFEQLLEYSPQETWLRERLLDLSGQKRDWQAQVALLSEWAESSKDLKESAWLLWRKARIEIDKMEDLDRGLKTLTSALMTYPLDGFVLDEWRTHAEQLLDLESRERVLREVISSWEKMEMPHHTTAEDLLDLEIHYLMELNKDPFSALHYLKQLYAINPQSPWVLDLYPWALARAQEWFYRAEVGLLEHQIYAERHHGLEIALALGVPEALTEHYRKTLEIFKGSLKGTLYAWTLTPPRSRPLYHLLPNELRKHDHLMAQGLRRWSTLASLSDGTCTEPSSILLSSQSQGLREVHLVDLELMSSFYEVSRRFDLLLQVLELQQRQSTSTEEEILIVSERCRVFDSLNRHEEATQILREIFKHCEYEDPYRETLYDQLEERHDWSFLEEEIRRHISHIRAVDPKTQLWMRLGRVLEEGLNNLKGALDAWTQAVLLSPQDTEILKEIVRLGERLEEWTLAFDALTDFLALTQPDIQTQIQWAFKAIRIQEHLREGGDPQWLLEWLEKLMEYSGRDPKAVRALARAHAKFGEPLIAGDLFNEILDPEYREEDIEDWLILAEIILFYFNQPENSESIYWELFLHFPDHVEIWEAIDKFYGKPEYRGFLAEQLEIFIQKGKHQGMGLEWQQKWSFHLAKILGEDLGEWEKAEQLLSKAKTLSGKYRDEVEESHVSVLFQIPGQFKTAYEKLCEILPTNPFQPELLVHVIQRLERGKYYDRVKIFKQLGQFFMPDWAAFEDDFGNYRPKVMPTRRLSEALLKSKLLHPQLHGKLYELLYEALPLIRTVYGQKMPKLSTYGGEKIKTRDPMGEFFQKAALILGIDRLKIYVGEGQNTRPLIFPESASIWIPRDRWEVMSIPERRHWAGYALGLMWTGLSPYMDFQGVEIWQVLDAVYYLESNGSSLGKHPTTLTLEHADKISGLKYRNLRKGVYELIREIGNLNKSASEGWIDWIQWTGDRSGLLFSGEIGVSLRAILSAKGWRGPLNQKSLKKHLREMPNMRALIAFLVSEDYLELRYESGLSTKPQSLDPYL